MQYNNTTVRRQDRLLDEKNATELLQKGEFGVLSIQDDDEGAYGVPLNYVWDGKNSIYIHCASEGKKLLCINRSNKTSFCIVGKTKVIPEKFSTCYESIILKCIAFVDLSETEKMKALELLVEKYSPDYNEEGIKYAAESLTKTKIIRLDIQEWSGKCKRID